MIELDGITCKYRARIGLSNALKGNYLRGPEFEWYIFERRSNLQIIGSMESAFQKIEKELMKTK